ncbi:hypothetical protein [Pantoea anthophila]|uniref:hypothetical protein n=1 Tax=Pantoea anthophila TaxID=470931 RepID=UPI002DBC4231|nr:hypothetical protein [Pantoea anthophila]MEB5708446.1 hypothetical protein [Pantoea anthophila]MEB6519318.1 hypothetical protein [Pantoea anthophila]
MTKQLFTVFDTDFDLSDLDDCHAFVDALEAFGKIHTWKLYDLLCEVDQIQGDEEDYDHFLHIIAEKFGRTIDTERELCTDDAAAKTILTTFSSAIGQYFRSNGAQPFVMGFDATPFVGEEVEHFTLEGFGTASEANHVPVQQVEILTEYKSHLVTKVIKPVGCPITKTVHIGNIDSLKIFVETYPRKDVFGTYVYSSCVAYGRSNNDYNTEITDEIADIAHRLLDNFMSREGWC